MGRPTIRLVTDGRQAPGGGLRSDGRRRPQPCGGARFAYRGRTERGRGPPAAPVIRRVLAILALAVLAPVSVTPAQPAAARPGAPHDDARAQTANGAVQGLTLASGVRTFRGIPYAAPPVRDLRWRPPQPAQRWTGVRPADRFEHQCLQARPFGDMMFRNAGGSEDCLYLNVWTPAATAAAPTAKRPVLFYIHGGGWIAGDGSEPRYDGESMARRGIVVVTISHRLGIFGFFAHPELAAESPEHATGNYGYLDQTAALRWVRENIAAFGGDPQQVTIAGESAGSFAVSAQMASPLARGLFARAIGESGAHFGTSLVLPTRAESEQNGVQFAERVGARSLADLRALSATELLEASGQPGASRFSVNVDGYFFPKSPAEVYAAGEQAKVPLLAGWNSEEMTGRALLQAQEDATPERARAILAQQFGAHAAEAERVYPVGSASEAMQSLTDLASDRFIGYGTWKWLEEHGRTSGQPVYRYLYTRPRPAPVEAGVTANLAGGVTRGAANAPPLPATGAVHSAEIEYALGNLPLNTVFAWTPDDYRVSATMQGYFANFIRTGDPNGAGLPTWPRGAVIDGHARRIRIDVETRAEPEPRARYLFLDRTPASARRDEPFERPLARVPITWAMPNGGAGFRSASGAGVLSRGRPRAFVAPAAADEGIVALRRSLHDCGLDRRGSRQGGRTGGGACTTKDRTLGATLGSSTSRRPRHRTTGASAARSRPPSARRGARSWPRPWPAASAWLRSTRCWGR